MEVLGGTAGTRGTGGTFIHDYGMVDAVFINIQSFQSILSGKYVFLLMELFYYLILSSCSFFWLATWKEHLFFSEASRNNIRQFIKHVWTKVFVSSFQVLNNANWIILVALRTHLCLKIKTDFLSYRNKN